jgi:uncharacterized protein DUF5659
MEIHEEARYRTDHLYLAAYLTCSGYRIESTATEGTRVFFVFRQTPELSAAVADFMSGAAIPARHFAFEVLKLKHLIPRAQSKMEKNVTYANEQGQR